jgi:hypothetical protein
MFNRPVFPDRSPCAESRDLSRKKIQVPGYTAGCRGPQPTDNHQKFRRSNLFLRRKTLTARITVTSPLRTRIRPRHEQKPVSTGFLPPGCCHILPLLSGVKTGIRRTLFPPFPELLPPAPEKSPNGALKMPGSVHPKNRTSCDGRGVMDRNISLPLHSLTAPS